MGHRTRAAIAVVSGMIALAAAMLGIATPAAAQASTATTAASTTQATDTYCEVTYTGNSWSTGYVLVVSIRNISSVPVRWQSAILQLPDPVVAMQFWNATATQSGSALAIYPSPPASGLLAPGESRTIGFISSWGRPLTTLPTAVVTCSPA